MYGVKSEHEFSPNSADSYSHAYIVWGCSSDARSAYARRLAAAMICEGSGNRPCGKCVHCEKAKRGVHPDIIEVELLNQKREITVNQVRALREDAFIMPNEARKKVYIIDHAINVRAQNALLKILEEPPGSVSFILTVQSTAELLPTVRSRCTAASTEVCDMTENRNSGSMVFEFMNALSDVLKLTELSFKLEKLEKDKFIEFIEDAKASVLLKLKNNFYTGTEALEPDYLIYAVKVLDRAKEYLDFNVGLVHIAGMICAELYIRKEEQHD